MKTNDQKVDRSRLKLLGLLVAGGAAGGCGPMGAPVPMGDLEKDNPFSTLRDAKSKPKIKPVEPAGGEGGEAGGGSH